MTEPGLGKGLRRLSSSSLSPLDLKLGAIPPVATRWQACLPPWLDAEDSSGSSHSWVEAGEVALSVWGRL